MSRFRAHCQRLDNASDSIAALLALSRANAGVLVGGDLVLWTGQARPDLVVGLAVAAIALKGGIRFQRDANCEAGRSQPR
ncbi:MAG: hypothetical protein KY442_12335 [Proteobacteria bacterium]|nr:hypothetical protein [Pseudomonadota bacterium]